jgi:hypothetical protein
LIFQVFYNSRDLHPNEDGDKLMTSIIDFNEIKQEKDTIQKAEINKIFKKFITPIVSYLSADDLKKKPLTYLKYYLYL